MFRVRFRFKVVYALNTDEQELNMQVDGKTVRLQGAPDISLNDSTWLIATVGGFPTEESARQWGERLRQATSLAAMVAHYGVNVGRDQMTSGIGPSVVEWFATRGFRFRGANIHGLDVYPDDDGISFPARDMTSFSRMSPGHFLPNIDIQFSRLHLPLSSTVNEASRLINSAQFSPESESKLVLGMAAVEMLAGVSVQWTENQRGALARLMLAVRADPSLSEEEKTQLTTMLENSRSRSIARGVRELLRRLDLAHRWKEWEESYSYRSALFHGRRPSKSVSIHDIVTLCADIVLAAVARETGS